MLDKLRLAAIAATLSLTLAPAASLGGTSPSAPTAAPQARAAAAVAAAPVAAPAPEPEFGLEAHDHDHGSGLAPGQNADDFRNWLARSPVNRARLAAFEDRLAAEGVDNVVPVWQLVRTSSSWRQCGADPFEVAPADKWDNIVTTLKFVRDKVEPAIGKVEALSAYRNERLNACSAGAPRSAHRQFFALDLTPVAADVSRDRIIRGICAAHSGGGSVYRAGLGFYSGRRFHVDSNGFRKWGPDGRGASSPCVTHA
ncbi:MAG TPA: D-Ala-D-Ala carboxypeptidase family metallohydrolase [Allosphingosinicella sp.]|nr:D-Ala-D-Ala carboxypeptidase family metallohydrolase [Allosphingosinicella sp.]